MKNKFLYGVKKYTTKDQIFLWTRKLIVFHPTQNRDKNEFLEKQVK